MTITLNHVKNFWVEKIIALLVHKGVNAADLVEGADWEDKLKNEGTWDEIRVYAKNICQDIYGKATAHQGVFPAGNNINNLLNELVANAAGTTANAEYWRIFRITLYGFQRRYLDLMAVVRDKIGVDPDSNAPATDAAGNNILGADGKPIPKWKYDINDKIPNGIKLTDAPGRSGLLYLLYKEKLFKEIVDDTTGLGLIEWGAIQPDGTRAFVGNSHGYNFVYKVNTTKLQEYKDAKNELTTAGNQIGVILGLAPTDLIPNDWYNQLAKKADLDIATATIGTLTTERDGYKTKSDDYDRIHTKLSGKVSDSELDTLLNTPPQCSHTDYDTIKNERDTLTTEKTATNQKITSELGLAENSNLDQILAKIKELMKTPDTADKDSKITELETKITNLQSPKSLNDLPISDEVKAEVIQISQELGLTSQACAKLENATSYQELSTLQKEVFQEKLASEVSSKKSAHYLNYGLGALTIGSLLILAYLLMKGTKLPELGDKKVKE